MKSGMILIAEERVRQRDKLWGDSHDDMHEAGVLARAGICYIVHGACQIEAIEANNKNYTDLTPPNWPFADEWWKPSKDPIRNMQKGAAMVAAEMDRHQRTI